MKCYEYITICVLALFLTGCAATYVPPSSGPTTTIVTRSGSTAMSIFQNARECTGLRSNTAPLWETDKPLVVQANQTNTFLVRYESDIYSCRYKAFSFNPKVNNRYQVVYEPQGGSFFKAPKCILKVTNLTTQKEEKFIVRKYHQALLYGEGGCEDKLSK